MGATASAGGFGGGAGPVAGVHSNHGQDDRSEDAGLRLAALHLQLPPAGEDG